MVNIVIKESDTLFQCGLTFFFSDFFSQHNTTVDFNFNFTSESVQLADVIALALCPGECFICCPELQKRKKGIVIGFVDDDMRASALPSCFQDIIFISRRHSVRQLRRAVHTAWHRLQQTNYRQSPASCFDCQPTKLSPQQIRIMICLYEGMSVTQIADELMISEKTVYAHKYMVMSKFNLRNDYELMLLLNKLTKNNDWPNGFIKVSQ
ncbi:helix-turn-helix transcriptional regulator [Klebsiella quasipneumoniae]|uniref:helix-turn-helix transcriptional regulator n=1 Tax=Klebsiella quasipneumoniae TaxID=1463165 RepID=UPI001091463B|nr:LuxR family transcriptional regulator [Klebsiella quasipneumoniae]MCA4033888.1 LuxR C-terminal-related transcriptional regulator [Klebsiella quasipneumoniae]MCQ3860360.1 LuxR C-terminal-related transcriptional regulator [Klebsiella quasipneumoniae]VGK97823.1 LuxR family transcriptional regulator [Klebsiella quasipneumoniae]